jgi:hypothetical protein
MSSPGGRSRAEQRLAVEHEPADGIPHALIVKDEIPNRVGKLVGLPAALESRCPVDIAAAAPSRAPLIA